MSEKNFTISPRGVSFKFIVKPSLSANHQNGLRYYIVKKSGLDKYFKDILVSFYDGHEVQEGMTIHDDKLAGKQMVVRVFCPEPIVLIHKENEIRFYKQIQSKFAEWIIDIIQSNTEKKYEAKLGAFLLVTSYSLERKA